ncbi:hypothetical protein N7517_003547 [Penicillium concentricum]|uniref:Uncharacterized protein n=1 Tax=Penicillium concentricum TaxID=293559 RepID=A0A9W9S3X1_9EURO|nr:uncharacterized protein N7517_003547 [Penicillium concentricum]KAJ5371541.1 hypothetical protein N7517_003547 [Penicillium concentricum]
MLSYIECLFTTLRPITKAYAMIRLVSPIPPIPSLPVPTLRSQCLYENCFTISIGEPQGLIHLRNTHSLRGPTSKLNKHLIAYHYQGLQKNRFFFATQGPHPQGSQPQASQGSQPQASQDPQPQASQDPEPQASQAPERQASQAPESQAATTVLAQLRAYHTSQQPASQPRTLGPTSRHEVTTFQRLTGYIDLIGNRDLSKIGGLFNLSIPDAQLPPDDLRKFLLLTICSLFKASNALISQTSRSALVKLMQFSSEREGIRPFRSYPMGVVAV